MAAVIRIDTVRAGRQSVDIDREESLMHPGMVHELARIKIAEDLEWAARERLARGASPDRQRWIAFSSLVQRARGRFLGGAATGGTPAAAGA
jgi:hypothetical protein